MSLCVHEDIGLQNMEGDVNLNKFCILKLSRQSREEGTDPRKATSLASGRSRGRA